jgi:ATP-binding cassette subfamily E protein 1
MRFRDTEINFRMGNEDNKDMIKNRKFANEYDEMTLVREDRGNFKMMIMPGGWSSSEITVIMGQNGTGKTSFIKIIAGQLKMTTGTELPKMNVSYKPQTISPKFPGTVEELFHSKIKTFWLDPQFQSDVVKPLKVDHLKDLKVQDLSGGELQRAAIVLALGKPADVYLLDEPSAFLDSEQRIECSKVIRKFILNFKKTCFMVEHDFIMASYCADRIIVFDGEPGVNTIAHPPMSLCDGMNKFLKLVDITFRRDP